MKLSFNKIFVFLIYCFGLQSFIGFDYLDEIYALIGIVLSFVNICHKGKISIKKKTIGELSPFLLFVFVGICGDIIYRYQNIIVVLIDLFTNLKFYLSIYTTMLLIKEVDYQKDSKIINKHIRAIVLVLFVLLIINYIYPIFPVADTRYGIASQKLFFVHPTYMAAYVVFLLSCLTFFYDKKNNIFIIMTLILIASTLRGKAIGVVLSYCAIYIIVVIYRKKLNWWHIAILGIFALFIGWEQIYFYYIELNGSSARSVLTTTSFQIAWDYFPIGTGFATYASNMAGEHYSPVYIKYGINLIGELTADSAFLDDTFWPIIIAQTGILGTIGYILYLLKLFLKSLKIKQFSKYCYATVIFIFAYLMISSTSEPAFNNTVAVPLAIIIGYSFMIIKKMKF